MSKTRRTFPTGGAVSAEELVDREAVLGELLVRTFEHGNSVVVRGPRQIGKTSVALELLARVRRAGGWGIYIDCSTTTDDLRNLADLIARATYDQASGSKGAFQRLREIVRDAPKPVLFQSDVDVSLAFHGPNQDPALLFERALGLADELAAEKDRRCVVVYDEFQEMAAVDAEIFTRVRAVLQHRMSHTAYVFMGSDVGMLDELFKSPRKMPFRLATPLTLPTPEPAAWSHFIEQRFTDLGLAITPEETERLLTFTGGHPRDLMEACEHLLVVRSIDARTRGSLEIAEARTLDGLRARFDEVWRRLDKPRGTRTTAARISHGQPVYGRGRPAAPATRTIEKLEREGIIRKTGRGAYEFTEPLFGRYVAEITGPTE
jgi:hypothetical protein